MISKYTYFEIYFLVFLADLLSYLYLLIKIYKVLCYTKLTLNQMLILNPYIWPLSFFRIITNPFFKFCKRWLPRIRMSKQSFDISVIIGLEILGLMTYVCAFIRVECLFRVKQIILMNS